LTNSPELQPCAPRCWRVVEEVGPNAQGVRKGDRVMLPFQIFCGGRYYCKPRSANSTLSSCPHEA